MSQGITRTPVAAKCTNCGSETPGPRERFGIGNVALVLCPPCMAALHRRTAPTEDAGDD